MTQLPYDAANGSKFWKENEFLLPSKDSNETPLMRKRLTLGDMLIFMDWDRDVLWNTIWKEDD